MSWMLLMFACESMSNPGNPFAPVAMVSTSQTIGGEEDAETQSEEDVSDEFRDPQEVIDLAEPSVTASESTGELANPAENPGVSSGPPTLADASSFPQTVVTPEMQQNSGLLPSQTIVTQALDSTPGASTPVAASGAGGWPVRLVGTMSDAQPPRAVLGFATGEEVVVTPGMLLPAHQIVVMSIGASQVQLAQIIPTGDRATIQSMSLQAAYPE